MTATGPPQNTQIGGRRRGLKGRNHPPSTPPSLSPSSAGPSSPLGPPCLSPFSLPCLCLAPLL